jgi:hypothetical protein
MKKTIRIVSCICLLVLNACSSSDSSTPATESDILVTKTIEHYANDNSSVTTNYTYNGKKLVSTLDSDGYKEMFTYTGDLITSVKWYDDTDTLLTLETFTYNSSNQITQYVLNDYDTDHGRKEMYVHNSNGTVSYTVYNGDNTTQTNLLASGTFYVTNGEVTKIETTTPAPSSTSSMHIYTYDTKNNPFKNILGYDKMNYTNEEAIGVSHNILTDHFTSNGGSDDLYTTTISYNGLNFPVTASEVEGTNPTTEISTEYFYNN